MKKQVSIRQKLWMAFTLMMGFVVLVGIASTVSVVGIQANLEDIFQRRLPSIDSLVEADRDLQQLLVAERTMIFTDSSAPLFATLLKDHQENLTQAQERLARYKSLALAKDELESIAAFENAWTDWIGLSRQVVDGRKADTREGRRLAIDLSQGEAAARFESMRAHLNRLEELNLDEAGRAHERARTTYARVTAAMIAIVALALVLGGGVIWRISRGISAPLQHAVAALQDIAQGQGDLTQRIRIETGDEIGDLAAAFNTFAEKMQRPVQSIAENATTLASSAEQLMGLSHELHDNAEATSRKADAAANAAEQASHNVASVAAASQQMTATIREISGNAHHAAEVASTAVNVGQRTEQNVVELGRSSDEISQVLGVINSIAEKTHLLALNATIEAARAGDSGKGFAVVAGEVKQLANQTARATEDVARKISAIQSGTRNVVASISEINALIEKINGYQASIASAVEEQSATSNEIGRSVTEAAGDVRVIAENIVGAAQAASGTSASASQTEDAAGALTRIAAGLQGFVQQFRYQN